MTPYGPYDIVEKLYQTLLANTTKNLTPMPTPPEDYPRGLPFLRILPSAGTDTEDGAQSGAVWTFSIHAGWEQNLVQRIEAWTHADANLQGSLHWAIKRLHIWLKDEMRVQLHPDFSFSEQQITIGPKTSLIWNLERTVSVEIPPAETTQTLLPVVNNPAYPPRLPADWHDIWGIEIISGSDVLYLAESSPRTIAEAEIHSIDLTTNDRRISELSAGISQQTHHRSITSDDRYLYTINLEIPSRFQPRLSKLDPANNTRLASVVTTASADAIRIFGPNKEFIAANVDEGATTRWEAYNTSDLSRNEAEDFTEEAGPVSGSCAAGDYFYDIVGCWAMCFDSEHERQRGLDIALGGNRTHWRDATIREDHLWVAGESFAADTPVGFIGSFRLPKVVADSL